jgi:crotonobetainyl-CoA:carnitine CoA-transferase CaiB-like acyl-CoA transferase
MRPLDGIRVLDFSTLLPGPMASLLLAEAGAEVLKIERPGRGEEMRSYEPRWGAESVNFALLNRGKKSIAADLKDPATRDRVLALAKSADIVLEQFRPGVMDRLGFGYEAMRAQNPRIIYCAITGYGQSGPRRDRAGHDLNYIGDTGLLALSSGPPGARVVPPALVADIAGGAYPAVMNILLALRRRDATGEGAYLDIAMTDSLLTFEYWAIGAGLATGQWPGNATDLTTGGTPRYHLYETRDGRIVAAAPIEQRFWELFVAAIGLEPAFADDARDPAATTARIAEIMRSRDAAEWAAIFDGADCCCSIVQDVRTAMADAHFRARGLFAHVVINEAGARMPALPVPISGAFRAAPSEAKSAPALGAHNREIET